MNPVLPNLQSSALHVLLGAWSESGLIRHRHTDDPAQRHNENRVTSFSGFDLSANPVPAAIISNQAPKSPATTEPRGILVA